MTRQCTDCMHGDVTEMWCAKNGNTVNKSVARLCADFEADPLAKPPAELCPTARTHYAKVTSCYSNTYHCPFRNGESDMQSCNAANGKLLGVEWGQSPEWCPLRRGPITVERAR